MCNVKSKRSPFLDHLFRPSDIASYNEQYLRTPLDIINCLDTKRGRILTNFAISRDFENHNAVIQGNTIRRWSLLTPCPEIE